jgi:hypothetical protein
LAFPRTLDFDHDHPPDPKALAECMRRVAASSKISPLLHGSVRWIASTLNRGSSATGNSLQPYRMIADRWG